MAKIPDSRSEAIKWLRSFKVVSQWLEEVRSERTGSEQTQKSYLDHMRRFVDFTDMTPAELIEKAWEEQQREMAAKKPPTKTWAEKKALACLNELMKRGRRKSGALQVYGVARSFFRYNGIRFLGKTPTASVETIYHLPSNQQLAQAWKIATPEQRLAVGILRSTGMRPEDALALVWGDLQWQFDSTRAYIEKLSQKEDLRFGVFLTAETSELVRLEMQKRFGSVDATPEDARLLDCNYNNLLALVQRFGRNVKLRLSPKYFRKLFRTRCSPIIGKDSVQKMAGWKIAGAGKHYFLPAPEDCLKTYLEIERLLTFETGKIGESEVELRAGQRFLEMTLEMSPNIPANVKTELLRKIRAVKKVSALQPIEKEVAEAIKNEAKPQQTNNAACADGEHCQRIVSEAELGALLTQGWHAHLVLPSGKIVVASD